MKISLHDLYGKKNQDIPKFLLIEKEGEIKSYIASMKSVNKLSFDCDWGSVGV